MKKNADSRKFFNSFKDSAEISVKKNKAMKDESQYVEFKSSFNEAVIETVCAFVNAKGGCVYVGLDDKGIPVPNFSIGKETIQNWINEIKNKTQPSIIPDVEAVMIEGKEVICIRVNEFPVKPVSFRGRYYKRVNNANHQLSTMEITNLSLQSLQLSWDSYPAHGKSLKHLDLDKVNFFFEKVKTMGRFNLEGTWIEKLHKLKLLQNDVVSNAAWLLFANEPTGYNVHLGRLKTPSMIIDDKMLNGTLFEVVEETMKYIIGQIKVAFEIKGMPTQRTEIFEYPLPALREIVLNAIIHRDYTSPIDMQIKIFDNYISIYNPGGLYGTLTVDQLKGDAYQAIARNKLIAEAFYLTGDIEKYGSGFLRIRNDIKEYPTMKMEFSEVASGFLWTVSYKEQKVISDNKRAVGEKVGEKVGERITDNHQKILHCIEQNPNTSARQMAIDVGISSRKIEDNLKKLKENGILERVGGSKGGFWRVINKEIGLK